MLAGICSGRSGCNASADRRRGISSVSPILAPGNDFLARSLPRSRFFSAAVAQPPKPGNFVLNVIECGEIDLHPPLRRRGTLRDEPAALPWGIPHEIALTSVDCQERSIFVQSGLRASYTQLADDAASPSLPAGDPVDLVAQALLPQVFHDEGAFDRRRIFVRKESMSPQRCAHRNCWNELLRPNVHRTPRLPLFATDFAKLSLACFPTRSKKAPYFARCFWASAVFLDRPESVNFQKTGVIPDFLAAAQPGLAAISSGEGNSYGHPSPQLIERLEAAGVAILRTGTNGAIHILRDGKTSGSFVLRFVPANHGADKLSETVNATG